MVSIDSNNNLRKVHCDIAERERSVLSAPFVLVGKQIGEVADGTGLDDGL